jgi:protoporphyrinogen oxidase
VRERVVIVGGGVTGLALAGFLADSHAVTLLEREGEVGGYCRTIYQDGFTWDYSGHFFHFRHRWVADRVHARLDRENLLSVRKVSSVHFRGRHVPYPFQYNIHELPLADFVRCLADMHEAEAAGPREWRSFRDMLYGRYGRALSDLFLVPYNEKLYARSCDQLDPEAMGRFFPHIDLQRLLRRIAGDAAQPTYNDRFSYHRRGARAYVEALASYVPRGVVQTGVACERIDLARRRVHAGGTVIPYDRLVVTAPLPRTLALAGMAHDPGVFTANKVLVFNLGFDRPSVRPDHWVYFPEPEWAFFRVGHYDNILGERRMSLYVEVSLPQEAPAGPERHLPRVLADLARCGVIDGHRLVSHASVLLDPAYVHVSRASNAAAAAALGELARHDVHPLGRYGQWIYCSIEDNIVEAYRLARTWGAARDAGAEAA